MEGMSRLVVPYAALGLLGLAVGVVGTGGHRFEPPWGLVCVLLLVISAAIFARAWKSWLGWLVFSEVWLAIVLLLYFFRGPGNSVVISGDRLGWTWIIGGIIAAAVPALIPGRLLGEEGHDWR